MLSTMMDTPLSLATLFRHAERVHGGATITTATEKGVRKATLRECATRAMRLAHALRGLGITGDQRVGTFMWNNQEHFEAYMAVPAMGAVLHTLNIRLPPAEVVFIANAAEDRVVLVDASLVPLFATILPGCTTIEHVVVVGEADVTALAATGRKVHDYEALLAAASDSPFDFPVVDERLAAAIAFTSGTTGSPKGVAYSHRSAMLHSMQLCLGDSTGVSSGDRVLAVVPMFHVCAWGLPWACMLVGADLILTDRFLQPDAVARLITSERPTFGGAVPTIWTGLLQYVDKVPTDLSSFRMVLVGGSACPPALMKAFEERHKMRIVHAWGMTETSPLGSVAVVKEGLDEETAWKLRITQGRLSPFVEAKLLGPDGNEVPWDGATSGELCVRGPWVTGSYYPENDPEKFVDGWLRTGDVGTLTSDGYLTLTDRAKDVIKSGGEWISSVLLENLLMAHPSVLEACVVGVADDKWGERPLACVVPKPEEHLSFAELRAFLGEKVAKWQLPERWAQIPSVPKTSVGKFDKKVLRADYAANKLEVTIVD